MNVPETISVLKPEELMKVLSYYNIKATIRYLIEWQFVLA